MAEPSKADEIVERAQQMIREIKDPREFHRQFEEMLLEAFPAEQPVFGPQTCLEYHQFERAFKARYCGGVVPQFLRWPVVVETAADGEISVRFIGTGKRAAA